MKALIMLVLSLLTLFYLSHIAPPPVHAAPLTNAEFLLFSSEQQERWTQGAFDALGHLAYQSDKSGANCIWRWLNHNKQARREFLLETFKENPSDPPTKTILILLKHDCRLAV